MAFDSPPYAMDGTTQDAELFRRAIGTLLNPAGGIVTPGDLAVTQQATPNMSVQIGTGQIWVPGTSTATQGPYYSRNGATITQTISASNPSNPRVDTIIAQVQDMAYAGAAKQIAISVITGTATSGANLSNLAGAGIVPASSLVLAYILVPQSATSITTADIANVASPLAAAPFITPPPVAWTPLNLVYSAGLYNFQPYRITPAYRVNGNKVEFKGEVQAAEGSTTLPGLTGFASMGIGADWPAATVAMSVAFATETDGWQTTQLFVLTTGYLEITLGAPALSIISLENCYFYLS